MEWRPTRALTIVLFTEPDAPAAAAAVGSLPEAEREYVTPLLREGIGSVQLRSRLGNLMLLPVFAARGAGLRPIAEIESTLVHEYTHFVQTAIMGTGSVPRWYVEGQAVYVQMRVAGGAEERLATAVAAQLAGRTAPLADLNRLDGWAAHQRAIGRSSVYHRSYVAVRYLVERHGFAATVGLLRGNPGDGYDRFYDRLTSLTGMSLEAFERATAEWALAQLPNLQEQLASAGAANP
jgi:hypothetical protein